MNEKPLERLNYFNGQRLQAVDFKIEQDYHMRVRRWLNRSLYTAGIASGLDVRKVPKAPRVRVNAGLALDAMGREIILLDEREEIVPGAHDEQNRSIGLYLTIRYDEDVLARQDASCVPVGRSSDKLALGGPSRVVADPVFEWSRDVPREDSGRVILAYVGLGKGCREVNLLDLGVRRYIGAASAAKVKQYALEGARDIDAANAADVRFHIRGRQPAAVTLYLRAEAFPSFHYTETGQHKHPISVSVGDLRIPAHQHAIGADATGAGTDHTHTLSSVTADADSSIWHGAIGVSGVTAVTAATTANPAVGLGPAQLTVGTALAAAEAALFLADAFDPGTGMNLTLSPRPFRDKNGDDIKTRVNMSISLNGESAHTHDIPAKTTDRFPADGTPQVIPLSGTGSSTDAGITDTAPPKYSSRVGLPLGYVNAMKIKMDGTDITDAVLRQIRNNRPSTEDWKALGNGNADHPLAAPGLDAGTGPIRLDYVPGVTFSQGEHRIELFVEGAGNGGRIHYNLYVE